MRSKPLSRLLLSIKGQTLYPDEILIIDGSVDNETEIQLENEAFEKLRYFKVEKQYRGLTKQRNYGINLVSEVSEIICFLDDDIILTPDYFKNLIETHKIYPDALAVGGYITNEVEWKKTSGKSTTDKFYFDGWERIEPSRFRLRRKFGLQPDTPPGFLPTFAHGRSIGFLPPSRKTYQVEQIMGGVSSYRKDVFDTLSFSTYFEGYGLYEDTDFSLRLAKLGKLYVNTLAQLEHHHDSSGRPNSYKYGKMVLRNGWYTWRVKYPSPNFKSRVKWNATSFLLTGIRLLNSINTKNKKEALKESLGRFVGWVSLLINKPRIEK